MLARTQTSASALAVFLLSRSLEEDKQKLFDDTCFSRLDYQLLFGNKPALLAERAAEIEPNVLAESQPGVKHEEF